MKVFTYYHDVTDALFPSKLIDYWSASWKHNGFEPVLLQEVDARKHPWFSTYEKTVMTFPTVNAPWYERHCWIRWLAFELAGAGVFSDYDVFNFTLKSTDLLEVPGFLALDRSISPLFVSSVDGIRAVISMVPGALMSAITIDGKLHVSDMHLLANRFSVGMIQLVKMSVNVGDDKQDVSPCVHFANSHLAKELQFGNRWKAAEELYRKRGMTPPWEQP